MPALADVTTIILTYNEEAHIGRAIKSALKFSSEVIVVDSFSSDSTVEIAKDLGARVVQHEFESHARQFNWALDHVGVRTSWVMRLDADETIGLDLATRIKSDLAELSDDVTGILLNRKHVFMGRWVKYGGRYPLYMLRIWRYGSGRVEDRWMDEHVVVREGRLLKWEGEFTDSCERDISFFIKKHDKYASLEAIEVLDNKYHFLGREDEVEKGVTSEQAKLKRKIKDGVYNQLPFGIGPVFYFFYRYFIQRGFLDGKTGFVYHVMQGLWYRLLVATKVLEFEKAIVGSQTSHDRKMILQFISGVKLISSKRSD